MLKRILAGPIARHLKKSFGLAVPFIVVLSIFSIGLSGCYESSGGSGDNESGVVVLGLTDAASDFYKYEVSVTSLTLTKQNGAVVETLPVKTTVDFAQYVEMTEFLTAATIPIGRYTQAILELDYTDAEIQIQNDAGDPVEVDQSNILDEAGNSITTLSVAVQLQGRNALTIVPGVPAHLTLDFDLGASNQVDLTDPLNPVLTVKPTLIADLNPENPKIHRLRGPLKQVNATEGSFRLIIRPFIHIISGGNERFGTLEVVTDNSTVYDINGSRYNGSAGLEALSREQVLTAVIVIGDLNIATRRFGATQVYAGSSVPGGTLDVVTGNVVSRSANQVTVKGATLYRAGGSVVFNDEVMIQLGAGTTVNRQHSKSLFTINDISVGQHVMAFGELNSGETELDATEGHIGMLLTTIRGTIVSTAASSVVVKLSAIDGRKISQFDFTGTGAVSDADPDNYEVDSGSLDISGLEADDPVKLRGIVTAFGHAVSEDDFEARTLIDVANVKGLMLVSWNPPASDVITSLSDDNFSIDLSGVGLFHHLNRAGAVTDLTGLADAPIIEPKDSGLGLFQVVQEGRRQIFFTFDSFVEELEIRLENYDVTHIATTGIFDDANSILTSEFIIVGFK